MQLTKNVYFTFLPDSMAQLYNLKELILTGNNLSPTEEEKIRQMLPNTKIAFVPQKYFDPNVNSSWKQFTDSVHGYSFKYPAELNISNKNGKIIISNDLVNL